MRYANGSEELQHIILTRERNRDGKTATGSPRPLSLDLLPFAARDLGLDGIDDLLQSRLGIGLLALEIGLPDGLADDELLQAENVVGDRLGLVELGADQRHEVQHPVRL